MDEMVNVETFKFDDKEYLIAEEVTKGNINYYYLMNIKDPTDQLVKKSLKEDPNTLYPLDNDQEFDEAIELFNRN